MQIAAQTIAECSFVSATSRVCRFKHTT